MKKPLLSLLLAACLYLAVPAHAGLIVDFSPPNGNALDMTGSRVADDFTLAGTYTVDSVNFWYFSQEQGDLSAVTYGIYQDFGGVLGTLLFTGTVAPVTSFDSVNQAYFATASVGSLDLGPGTYWLELHAGDSFTGDNGTLEVDWGTVDDNASAIALVNTSGKTPDAPVDVRQYEQLSFQLDAANVSSVPEPSPGWLTGPGLTALLGFAAFRARRQAPLK